MSRGRTALLILSGVLLAANLAGCGNETRNNAPDDTSITTPTLLGETETSDATTSPSTPPNSGTTGPDGSTTPNDPSWTQSTTGPGTATGTTGGTTTSGTLPPTYRPPTKGETTGSTTRPPTKGTTSAPPTKSTTAVNSCGTPPSGQSPDGKLPQRIVFPSPGNHQWPDTKVTLRACATSGLKVVYQLHGEASGGGCYVVDPTSTTLQFQGPVGSCAITATQPGNSTYAPAASVTNTWKVSPLVMTSAFVGASDVLLYDARSPTVTLHARVSAIHPLPQLSASVGIVGSSPMSCEPPGVRTTIGGDGSTDVRFDVPVKLIAPTADVKNCYLYVSVQVNQTVSGGQHSRNFTVRAK
ncbi:hypothetical protein OG555_36965 [Kribbella sp. NBC_01484]|uniref:hypothetical protein n=1 Tax=Kribbella sp. NBC_01484 TaxID=2903579 RepID=UPI002E37958B|nr:hypothetical protein [Kribbella sp. NBC_01484]